MGLVYVPSPTSNRIDEQGGYIEQETVNGVIKYYAQQIISLGTLIAGEDQVNNVLVTEERYTPYHINALGTFVVKGAAGFMRSIVINTVGTGITLTVYNNNAGSGPEVAVITPTAPVTLTYDGTMGTGITVVVAGTTAGSYTVNFR